MNVNTDKLDFLRCKTSQTMYQIPAITRILSILFTFTIQFKTQSSRSGAEFIKSLLVNVSLNCVPISLVFILIMFTDIVFVSVM